jgi:hypothetical protein
MNIESGSRVRELEGKLLELVRIHHRSHEGVAPSFQNCSVLTCRDVAAVLAAREQASYDWKSKTTWRLRVCEICGRDAANLALVPSCEHRMVEVVVAPVAAREDTERCKGCGMALPNHADECPATTNAYLDSLGCPPAREDTERPDGPCSLCIGAMPDGEWCRACGFGKPKSPAKSESRSPILEAVRKARGDLTGAEVVESILATHPPGCDCGKHASAARDTEQEHEPPTSLDEAVENLERSAPDRARRAVERINAKRAREIADTIGFAALGVSESPEGRS